MSTKKVRLVTLVNRLKKSRLSTRRRRNSEKDQEARIYLTGVLSGVERALKMSTGLR